VPPFPGIRGCRISDVLGMSLGVVGGAVPASIPAGSGSNVPGGLVLVILLVAAGSVVAVRRQAVTD